MRPDRSELPRREVLGRGRFGLQFVNPAKAAAAAAGLALAAVAARPAASATGMTVTEHGVKVWVPERRFQGDMTFVQENEWQVIPPDRRARSLRGDPVMGAENVVAAFDSAKGCVSVYARKGDRLERRGTLLPRPRPRAASYRLLPGDGKSGPGVAVCSSGNRQEYALHLNADGIVEFRPARARELFVGEARIAYGIVPSLIGVDLVYDPRAFAGADRLHLPSANLFVGLVDGSDSMLVASWPPGEQLVKLGLDGAGAERTIDRLAVDTAGRSFHLSWIEGSGLWHREPLKATYLERSTAIGWKRPFDAKWIARVRIRSEKINYPFYFRHKKEKLWGRFMRGWYTYPFWFGGGTTYFHFTKKCPPVGEALVYFLDRPKGAPGLRRAEAATAAQAGGASPVQFMKKTLGEDEATRLLDLRGIACRPLVEHGNAVCAMTRKVGETLKSARHGRLGAKEKAFVVQYADDIATFIRRIRERIVEYDAFAKETKRFLEAEMRQRPGLPEALHPLRRTLDDMIHLVERKMPRASLEEVRQWTEQIKKLAAGGRGTNGSRYKKLAGNCTSVAGGQDDLARDLCILAIRLFEQAGALGVRSEKRARLSEQIIARTRRVLRRPTWWEAARHDVPPSDPGIPQR